MDWDKFKERFPEKRAFHATSGAIEKGDSFMFKGFPLKAYEIKKHDLSVEIEVGPEKEDVIVLSLAETVIIVRTKD